MWLLNYLSTYGLIMQLATAIRHLQYTLCYELLRERAIGRGTLAGLSPSPPLHHYSGVSASIPQRIRSSQIRERVGVQIHTSHEIVPLQDVGGGAEDRRSRRRNDPNGAEVGQGSGAETGRGSRAEAGVDGGVAGGGRAGRWRGGVLGIGVRRGSRRTVGGWAGCGWVWGPIYLAFSS